MKDSLELEKGNLSLEQRYIGLLVAAHYLGGALRRLNETGKLKFDDLQIALHESGNDVEEGEKARFIREEASRLGMGRDMLEDVIATGFADALNFLNKSQRQG